MTPHVTISIYRITNLEGGRESAWEFDKSQHVEQMYGTNVNCQFPREILYKISFLILSIILKQI